MEGAGHQRRVSDCPKSVPIARSFESVEETSQVAPSTSTNDSVTEITGEGRAIQLLTDLCTLSKNIADTEILWALNCVYFHLSGNSNFGVNDLFKRMFSDSEIALNYLMSESKFRYVNLAHISPGNRYTTCSSPAHAPLFDESLNDELQSKQLDVHVHYWSSENCRVESRYFT